MEFTINSTKRNIIILSSSFLILYVLISGFFFLFNGPIKFYTVQTVIQNIIYIIPFGYLMFVFFDYFRHYNLKFLQIAILIILVEEVIIRGMQITNIFDSTERLVILSAMVAIWITTAIILIIFLFQTKIKDYNGMSSVRRYAIVLVTVFVMQSIIPLFAKPDDIFTTVQLVGMTLAIPYIFTIDFAMKLYLKE